MKSRIFKIISIFIFLVAVAMLTVISFPLISAYNDPAKLKSYIESLGAWGLLIMFFVQVSQIVVALIPGEVVEFVAGALYGWLGGLIFCSAGIISGQLIIFQLVKIFGKNFVEKVAGSTLINKYKFLQDEKKLKSIIFLLFFLPGTPKDMLTYVAPLTKINIRDFLIITTIARIPSVLSSTFAGAAFTKNNFMVLLLTYAGILFFTIIGLLIYKFVYLRHKPHVPENQDMADIPSQEEELYNKI